MKLQHDKSLNFNPCTELKESKELINNYDTAAVADIIKNMLKDPGKTAKTLCEKPHFYNNNPAELIEHFVYTICNHPH